MLHSRSHEVKMKHNYVWVDVTRIFLWNQGFFIIATKHNQFWFIIDLINAPTLGSPELTYRVFEKYFPINSTIFATVDGEILLEYPVERNLYLKFNCLQLLGCVMLVFSSYNGRSTLTTNRSGNKSIGEFLAIFEPRFGFGHWCHTIQEIILIISYE